MILNYTLNWAMGEHNQKNQCHRMRGNEVSKAKLYFLSSILYLIQLYLIPYVESS